MPQELLLAVGQIAIVTGTVRNRDDGWPVFVCGVVAVVAICAIAIAVKERLRPSRTGDARRLCPECGYDIRATPERCPECGTVRPETRPRAGAAPPPSRMLWSVHFQAGKDVLDILVWRELMPTVDVVYGEQPAEADLLFAATGTDGDAIIASGDLRRAAQGILDLIDSRRSGFALGDVVATAARRARLFARQHPYARFQRTVTRRAA